MQVPAKSQQGFTLVELLIVVAIIGILAAIAIPQFGQYREDAQVSSIESELRNCSSEASARFAQEGSDASAVNCDLGEADQSSVEVTYDATGLSIDTSVTTANYTCSVEDAKRIVCSEN